MTPTWWSATPLDVCVDSDSVITNSAAGGVSMATAHLRGAATLTIGCVPQNSFFLTTTTNSPFTGMFRVHMASTLSLGTPATNGPAGWQYSRIDLAGTNVVNGGTNATVVFSLVNIPVNYSGTLTGNGRFMTGYQGYGGSVGTLADGGVIAPGRPGTNEAGTIWLGWDRFTFASNSEYRVDVTDTNLADLIETRSFAYDRQVDIAPGAKMSIRFWTPKVNVPGMTVDVLRVYYAAGNGLLDADTFETNTVAAKGWSNLQVVYERLGAGTTNRVYITGAYAIPPPQASMFMIR